MTPTCDLKKGAIFRLQMRWITSKWQAKWKRGQNNVPPIFVEPSHLNWTVSTFIFLSKCLLSSFISLCMQMGVIFQPDCFGWDKLFIGRATKGLFIWCFWSKRQYLPLSLWHFSDHTTPDESILECSFWENELRIALFGKRIQRNEMDTIVVLHFMLDRFSLN